MPNLTPSTARGRHARPAHSLLPQSHWCERNGHKVFVRLRIHRVCSAYSTRTRAHAARADGPNPMSTVQRASPNSAADAKTCPCERRRAADRGGWGLAEGPHADCRRAVPVCQTECPRARAREVSMARAHPCPDQPRGVCIPKPYGGPERRPRQRGDNVKTVRRSVRNHSIGLVKTDACMLRFGHIGAAPDLLES